VPLQGPGTELNALLRAATVAGVWDDTTTEAELRGQIGASASSIARRRDSETLSPA